MRTDGVEHPIANVVGPHQRRAIVIDPHEARGPAAV